MLKTNHLAQPENCSFVIGGNHTSVATLITRPVQQEKKQITGLKKKWEEKKT